MRHRVATLAVAGLLAASAGHAERKQVYSLTGVDCADCGAPIKTRIKKIKGVKKVEFDVQKVELTVTMEDGVSDQAVLAAIGGSGPGFKATIGPGKGAYIPFGKYPEDADVIVLTESGAPVGPLEKLRAPGKYTVFDLYADWCGPCRVVDNELREVVARRQDVAVRKLNVVGFESALAREQGAKLKALPYLVVFSPSGKRTDLIGHDAKKLAAALGQR